MIGVIKIDQKVVTFSLSNNTTKKVDKSGLLEHQLQADSVFKEIKNLHNAAVMSVLDQKLSQLKELRVY